MHTTQTAFLASDGRRLTATLREPAAPRAAVVLAGATGVPARAYSAFADALAWAGLAVLTFDYRAISESKQGPVRAEAGSMGDWGRLDLEGALSTLAARHPALPLLLLGHSVGGQLLGLAPSAETLRGALLVGAQQGYWRNWPGLARARMWLNWHVVLPGLTRCLGYAPMRAMGMGENLPAGVAQQWARWGRHPEHFLSECSPGEWERYARFGFPMRFYHFTDDGFAPLAAVQRLAQVYRSAPTDVLSRAPADVGVSAIGHFGWLKPQFRETLWQEMADWLLARADAVRQPLAYPASVAPAPLPLRLAPAAARGKRRPEMSGPG